MTTPTIIRQGAIALGPLTVTFHRTLRIPDDGRSHGLPPSLGTFPLLRVDDYADRVPADWLAHGGVFLPMHQREALWLGFSTRTAVALKVGAGLVNAITGAPWADGLRANGEQDYVVCPDQPWLDGFKNADGLIRQFVAMPLGSGYTVEGQLSGREQFGGVQLEAFAGIPQVTPRPARPTWADTPPDHRRHGLMGSSGAHTLLRGHTQIVNSVCMTADASGISDQMLGDAMGMAAGGQMQQRIYPDRAGVSRWMTTPIGRVYVHLADPALYAQITGSPAPPSPVDRRAYETHGYAWPVLNDRHRGDVPASEALSGVASVAQQDAANGLAPQPGDRPAPGAIRDGVW